MRIKQSILNACKNTYIKEDDYQEIEYLVDCGEGINIRTISESLVKDIQNLDLEWIRTYPHTPALKEAIVKFWKDYVQIGEHGIFITEGTMGGIYVCSRMLLEENDKVLGVAPTFNAATSEFLSWGVDFHGIPMPPNENYQFPLDVLLNEIDESYKLVFIDNPNNPTGQVIPIEDIALLVQKAKAHNVGIIIDEAYGDYMSKSNSAATLIDTFDNLIVLKSFSKGFGLAGLRIGYMLTNKKYKKEFSKVVDAYSISSLSRIVAQKVLEENSLLDEAQSISKKIKCSILEKDWKNLSFSLTDKAIPIALLSHKDANINLAQEFAKHKIKVISGTSFENLSKNSVRFRIPMEKDYGYVMHALLDIDKIES